MRAWFYEAVVERHVDGDTLVMSIDLGMNQWSVNQYVKLAGIDAPETQMEEKEAGDAALAHLKELVEEGETVYLACVEYLEYEEYGRVLAVVYTAAPTAINLADGRLEDLMAGSINQEMLDSGHATAFESNA